jgi:hypothetical protein
MRIDVRSNININDDITLVPVSKQAREEHISQILSIDSLKNLTREQKKKEALKPMYLIRYE